MKKAIKTLFTFILAFSIAFSSGAVSGLAHSGRTDGSGGHHDYKNVSGLGSYHYHCGGHPAHLHKNGICPYSSTVKKSTGGSSKTSKYYRKSTVKKVQRKLNKLGYKCGKADGSYGKKTKKAIKRFQRRKAMTVNGKINKTLLKKLKIKIVNPPI